VAAQVKLQSLPRDATRPASANRCGDPRPLTRPCTASSAGAQQDPGVAARGGSRACQGELVEPRDES